jgi:hypothetical protein
MIGIGIDTGGTYTDAVVYDMEAKKILGEGKALTTHSRLEVGIANALDTLPRKFVERAELLTLSTTLATNACVENKGARARLLLLGFDTEMIDRLKEIYASYGFYDTSQFTVMEARPENLFSDPCDPDWEELKRRLPQEFSDCAAVGVVQKHPRANGGRFEKEAKKLLEQELQVPVTLAYDISDEVNILKCCAGTMLNARLIPLISEFIEAVKAVMASRNLDMPIAIVRSDGSLMSEQMAGEYPVETLVSGPAASVVGGSALAGTDSAWIVDMGGTTTDVALLKSGNPVMAERGIHIGQWKTMVKGLFVDTFGLGGDSAVRFRERKLYLDTTRVIPVSVLASEYPEILPQLSDFAERGRCFSRWLHEFYVLQKDISGNSDYTSEEQQICGLLKNGPVMTWKLAKLLEKDPYFLHTERLEEEGIVQKSGLTPTDMMVLKGDFSLYEPTAAQLMLKCIEKNVSLPAEDIPDQVYELVIHKLYANLARIFLTQKYPKKAAMFTEKDMQQMIEWFYEDARARRNTDETVARIVSPDTRQTDETVSKIVSPDIGQTDKTVARNTSPDARQSGKRPGVSLSLQSEYPLVGVGAPIHIFLPKVAELFGTTAIIPPHAQVANALGAIASRVVTTLQVRIKAEYENAYCCGYSVFEDSNRHFFKKYPDAEAFTCSLAKQKVLEKSKRQGASDNPQITLDIKEWKSQEDIFGVLLETIITAVATDRFQGDDGIASTK